jgi:hypothetical protein
MSNARLYVQMDVEGFDMPGVFDAIEEGIEEGFQRLAEAIEWEWRQKAAQTLRTSREEYLRGLSVDVQGTEITVRVTGALAVAVESGSEPFDMKDGFLRGALSRTIPMESPLRFRQAPAKTAVWWHPGIQARAIGDQVQSDMDRLLADTVNAAISRKTI